MTPDIADSLAGTVLERVGRVAGRAQERRPLASDLLESEEAFLVVFDAPDVTAANVQVRFDENTLYVRVDRTRTHREGFEMRFPGRGLSLDGEVTLPAGAAVDPTAATARVHSNGTLAVELPKRADAADGPIRIPTDEPIDGTGDTEGVDVDEATDEPDAYEPDE